MDFPAWPPAQIDTPAGIADALRTPVEWTGRSGNDYLLALVADERAVRELSEAHELTRGAQAPCTGEQPSCTPPFDIQISPLCSHLDVAAADRAWKTRRVRGAPVGRNPDGAPILFSRRTQVKVYRGQGPDPELPLRVLRALRSLNRVAPVVRVDERIPGPARRVLAGSRSCD